MKYLEIKIYVIESNQIELQLCYEGVAKTNNVR